MATDYQKLTNLMRSNDTLMAENQRLRLELEFARATNELATQNQTTIGLRLEETMEQNARLKEALAERHQQSQQAAPTPRKRR